MGNSCCDLLLALLAALGIFPLDNKIKVASATDDPIPALEEVFLVNSDRQLSLLSQSPRPFAKYAVLLHICPARLVISPTSREPLSVFCVPTLFAKT